MAADTLVNAYLDAQLVLAMAALIWLAARAVLRRVAPDVSHGLHLQMLYCVLTTALLAPVVLLGLGLARGFGWIGQGTGMTVTDIALAQYLDGRFTMAPSTVERILLVRQEFVTDLTTLATPLAAGLAGLLALGTGLALLRLATNIAQVVRIVRGGYRLRRIGRVDIRLTDRAVVPFSTRGLWRSHVVMPSTLLGSADDLRIAVAHELQHVRQGDLVWEVLFEVGRPLFFWNPAFHLLKRRVETLRELACDESVLRRGRMGVRDYCDCLLRVCRDAVAGAGPRRVLLPTVPFADVAGGWNGRRSAAFLRLRVCEMLDRAKAQPGLLLRSAVIVPMLAMLLLGVGLSQRSGDWSQDRLMLSTIVNLERMNLRTSMAGPAWPNP